MIGKFRTYGVYIGLDAFSAEQFPPVPPVDSNERLILRNPLESCL